MHLQNLKVIALIDGEIAENHVILVEHVTLGIANASSEGTTRAHPEYKRGPMGICLLFGLSVKFEKYSYVTSP